MYGIVYISTKAYIRKGDINMANMNDKKDMMIDVQPLTTKKEVNDLIEALGMSQNGLRDQLLFKLGITTGLRCGDLVALTVDQVKGKSNFKIKEGKTKKERTVTLSHVMADIADYLETLPVGTTHLFPSRKGDSPISTTQAYRIITKAGDLIGNESIGTHTMRKSFGYFYYQSTKDVATLMEIFNHSSQKITLRYIGITEESIENSIKSVSFF